MKYTASRVSSGNRVFPSSIEILDDCIVVKDPNFFSGKRKQIFYANISSAEMEEPIIGYSTVSIFSSNHKIHIHGFVKETAVEICELINEKIQMFNPSSGEVRAAEIQGEIETLNILERRKIDEKEFPWLYQHEFLTSPESFSNLHFHTGEEKIVKTMDMLVEMISVVTKNCMEENRIKLNIYFMSSNFKNDNPMLLIDTLQSKLETGEKMLNRSGSTITYKDEIQQLKILSEDIKSHVQSNKLWSVVLKILFYSIIVLLLIYFLN